MAPEEKDQSLGAVSAGSGAAVAPARDSTILPANYERSCGCSEVAVPTPYVLAVGRIEARFPRLAVEKEFAQAAGRSNTAGKTDREVLHAVLSKRENRYLARQMCWVMSIQGLDTYILIPPDPADFALLVESIRPAPSQNDIDVVVGRRGPVANPDRCNGLMVPIVAFEQIYSFDRAGFIKAIPNPNAKTIKPEAFATAAEEIFDRIMQLTDNAGTTDEHRALNYLAVRYPAIYSKAAEQFSRDFSLTGVEVRTAPLAGSRNVVDAIFSFTNRNTDFAEKFSVRVDVTEDFPFLVAKLAPYFDR